MGVDITLMASQKALNFLRQMSNRAINDSAQGHTKLVAGRDVPAYSSPAEGDKTSPCEEMKRLRSQLEQDA